MNNNFIINKAIYLNYKEEILALNPRIFDDPYFYDLKNYSEPIDLKGIINYLPFTDGISLYATSSLIDFINILLILSFLKKHEFKGKIEILYYLPTIKEFNKALISKINLNNNDYQNVDEILKHIINKEKINEKINLPGALNFISFLNKLVDYEEFSLIFEDENDLNYEEKIDYLVDNYSHLGLDKKFFEDYIKENEGNEYF